jgi:hypothetical protein
VIRITGRDLTADPGLAGQLAALLDLRNSGPGGSL